MMNNTIPTGRQTVPPVFYQAQTRRFTAVYPAASYPSFQEIHTEVDRYLNQPHLANEVRQGFSMIGKLMKDGWNVMTGKSKTVSAHIFPSGHTFIYDSSGNAPGSNIEAELLRISKTSEFSRKVMAFWESAILYTKAWAERIALMFAKRI
jgi:hypothetical protein